VARRAGRGGKTPQEKAPFPCLTGSPGTSYPLTLSLSPWERGRQFGWGARKATVDRVPKEKRPGFAGRAVSPYCVTAPWQCLNLRPLPQGQGELRGVSRQASSPDTISLASGSRPAP